MPKTLQRVPVFQLMLSEEQFRAIGHMVTQWAYLETEIIREIRWLLTRAEHKGKHVNFQAKFSRKLTRWEEMAQQTFKGRPKLIRGTARIANDARKLKRERDDICHGTMGSSGIFFKSRAGCIIDISDTIGTPQHIEDLACRISEISKDLLELQFETDQLYQR